MIWKTVIILGYFVSTIIATPIGIKNMQIMNDEEHEEEEEEQITSLNQKRTEMALSTLNLPSNATSIRADITDGFSCENLSYGYYADVENDCQVFHVCLPVVYPDGKENTFRWSFICPEETVFSQDSFTCMRSEDMSFGCEESAKYYELNRNFGMILDTSSEMNSNDMDITSHHVMHEKSELMEDDDEGNDKLKPIIKNDDQEYIPTISTTVKPVTIKLESNKKRRKNPNRKTQQIRKIMTTTAIPITTTTVKTIDQEQEITEKLIEKSTMKYQRFTRRPDINKDNKKKIDILNKVLTTQTQKRKKPQVSLNSNSKKNDINIKKDEKPVTEKIDILPLTTTTQISIPEIAIEKETLKPIIVKNDETMDDHLIGNNKEQDEILQTTTVITKLVELIPATEKPLSDEIISNMPEEEQVIAENNRITPTNVPQQFIKVEEEESMTHAADGNIKDNSDNGEKQQNNSDQQSMIINLISSLVNAENTKVGDEEKLGNIDTNVQNSQINNQNNDEQLNIMSELITTKVPVVQETVVEDKNLNAEHAVVNDEEKIKNEDDKGTSESHNEQEHQSYMYDHMTHIPVRIITDDLLPVELIAHENEVDQKKEVQETDEKNDKLESLNTDDKKLVMDKLEEALIEAIKMSEEQTDLKELQQLSEGDKLEELIATNNQNTDKKEEITNNDEVTVLDQQSEEIKPIYHRIFDEPANLLKPEMLSVLVEEQPIIHNIEEEVKTVQESEVETKAPELTIPTLNEQSEVQIPNLNEQSEVQIPNLNEQSEVQIPNLNEVSIPTLNEESKVIDSSSDIKPDYNVPENIKEEVRLENQPINEDPVASILPAEAQIPLESLPISTNTEEHKLQSSETISSSTAEPIVDVTTLSDRTNDARSLKNKMDPRKRRFLFRSDAR